MEKMKKVFEPVELYLKMFLLLFCIATIFNGRLLSGFNTRRTNLISQDFDRHTDTSVLVTKGEVVASVPNVKITFAEHIKGAELLFASVVTSEDNKTLEIYCTLDYEVVKVSDTVSRVEITIPEGSHGVAAIAASVDGENYAESKIEF